MSLFDRFLVTTLPLVPRFVVQKVASRYVAGETLESAVALIRQLNERGAMATLDVLGEEVTDRSRAEEFVQAYLDALRVIDAEGLDANISIKPTMLGLKIEQSFLEANVETLAEEAQRLQNFVRLDMEDRHAVDPTLETYRALQPRFGNLGVVFQAYMRRVRSDIDDLPAEGANVRLCKGIYIEPRKAAWKGYETVRRNFVAALEKLLRRGAYVGIATHDEYLVCAAVELIDRLGIDRDRYEFQMLLGVDEELRDILLDEGHRLRIYVPFGRDWYLYSMRRLRENPTVARHVLNAMLSGS
ncbi:MAG: proline dehydrogenase family protein [Acidobacteriota bacterium]